MKSPRVTSREGLVVGPQDDDPAGLQLSLRQVTWPLTCLSGNSVKLLTPILKEEVSKTL